MIQLTRLSGDKFVVNAEYIKFIESTPDTILTLRDGDKILVQESPDTVVERAVAYARSIRILDGLG
ncbi:MAG: flagellar FlbD family protein [Planctomycetota bacterium]